MKHTRRLVLQFSLLLALSAGVSCTTGEIGALSQQVTTVAEQIAGSTNSVRFGPEGLRFARPAELTLSYYALAYLA